MKLRNKKTGEVAKVSSCNSSCGKISIYHEEKAGQIGTVDSFISLAELNEEWEDYEEPKEHWFIEGYGDVSKFQISPTWSEETKEGNKRLGEGQKEIGNYFESEEEAERAAEKLKTYKRLKDKGFRFDGIEVFRDGMLVIDGFLPTLESTNIAERCKIVDDLELLFGEEEE